MTDQSVIVNDRPKDDLSHGRDRCCETSIALLALRILRVANGSSYPTHEGVSGVLRPIHVIASEGDIQFVGWVERSDTHQGHRRVMGFASLYPSYADDFAFSRRIAPEV
jgi:hypothetical protein